MIYAGGESSAAPDGRWRVLVRFEWPDGVPGWSATDPGDWTAANVLAQAFGAGMPHEVFHGGRLVAVRVTGALLVRMADE